MFEDTKRVNNRKLKNDRQHNCQKKNDKGQNITWKTKDRATRTH